MAYHLVPVTLLTLGSAVLSTGVYSMDVAVFLYRCPSRHCGQLVILLYLPEK